jgi:hypothetical protein
VALPRHGTWAALLRHRRLVLPGYPSRLSDARAELDGELVGDGPRLAYTVTQTAWAFGLSKSMIYD